MKTILVPVSSLENGFKTLQYAIDFAAHVSAKVYVLKVYGPNVIAGSIKTVGSLLEKDSKKELKKLIQDVDKKNIENSCYNYERNTH
jgi:nucleotide-binding universal stress UspA family protein